VFIIWLVDGRFPPAKSFTHMESLEEELRLLYVAATRAKDKLIMTYPGQELVWNTGGLRGNYQRGPSTFLCALPPHVMEHQSFLPSFMSPYDEPLRANPIDRSVGSAWEGPTGLKPGDRVNHPAFGVGVIARFKGSDKAEVIFRDKGIKLLHLGYTSLERV